VIDAASNSEIGWQAIDPCNFYFAVQIDITCVEAEILSRNRKDTVETVARVQRLGYQAVESGAAQILRLTLEGLGPSTPVEAEGAAQKDTSPRSPFVFLSHSATVPILVSATGVFMTTHAWRRAR